MSGLEIIERIEVTKIPDMTKIIVVLGCLAIVVILVLAIPSIEKYKKIILAGIATASVYLITIIILLISGVLEKPTGEYQYKVKIAEEVGFIEFMEKYKVIKEYDDGTFLIEEK